MSIVNDTIAKELPTFLSALTNLKKQITDSNAYIKSLIQKIASDEGPDRKDGLSFLEMKIHLVLEYLINLTFTMLLKVDGQGFEGQSCIERLVEIRTVLEKIRPINKKLSYQINKLIKLASTELAEGEMHPLSFKPKLNNLMANGDTKDPDDKNERSQTNDDADNDGSSVYVPPKVTAVPYDDDGRMSKKERRLEKARQRSLNSALLQDLREEFSEAPEQVIDDRRGLKHAKLKKQQEEREQYEEDHLRRLMITKKDKMLKRKINELDEVIKLGSLQNLDSEEESDGDDYKAPTKKRKGKGKFTKKKLSKRRK